MICRSKNCGKEYSDEYAYCPYCGTAKVQEARKALKRGNGLGSVYKLSGRRKRPWVVSRTILADGERKRIYLGYYEKKKDAQLALEYFCSLSITEHFMDTLGDVYSRWSSRTYPTLSKSAADGYRAAWLRLCTLEHIPMREIKTSHFQSIIDTAMVIKRTPDSPERPLSWDGKDKIRQLASQLCQEAMKDDIIDKNYAALIDMPPKMSGAKKRNFTADELKIIDQAASEDDAAKIIMILNYTGLRINELLKMPKSQVDLQTQKLVGGNKTEAGKNREVPIHESILPYIEYFMGLPGEFLITKEGKPVRSDSFLRNRFYPLLDRLGIHYQDENGRNVLTPHRSRHTFVAAAVSSGVEPEVLMDLVGHTKYSTTIENYNDDVAFEAKQKAMSKIK